MPRFDCPTDSIRRDPRSTTAVPESSNAYECQRSLPSPTWRLPSSESHRIFSNQSSRAIASSPPPPAILFRDIPLYPTRRYEYVTAIMMCKLLPHLFLLTACACFVRRPSSASSARRSSSTTDRTSGSGWRSAASPTTAWPAAGTAAAAAAADPASPPPPRRQRRDPPLHPTEPPTRPPGRMPLPGGGGPCLGSR